MGELRPGPRGMQSNYYKLLNDAMCSKVYTTLAILTNYIITVIMGDVDFQKLKKHQFIMIVVF